MKISKEVSKEIKSVIAYYRYKHLKPNEVLLKVFKIRWDDEREEVYLNQLDECVATILMQTATLLVTKHGFATSADLMAVVGITREGKIFVQENGELFIYHNKPKKVNINLVEFKSRNTYLQVEGSRAEQYDTQPINAY